MWKGEPLEDIFGGIFIKRKFLEEEGIDYPIRLEYYKTEREEKNVETKYGVKIIKKEYLEGNVKIETKECNNITNNLAKEKQILTLLKNNEVTPIGLEDVLRELI